MTAPQPDRTDPLFAPFWEGTDAHELRVQRCPQCSTYRWPPRPMCATCHLASNEWVVVAGRGTLFSWVGVEHQTVRGLPAPYTIALVELDDSPVRMLGRLVGVDREHLSIGMALVARFDESESGVTLANWARASN